MSSVSMKEFEKYWWSEVYNRIIGATIFIDDASSECLHWNGGVLDLLSGGATAVRRLSPFECANKNEKKGVFITHTTAVQLRAIRNIITSSDFTHCILISVVSLDIVYFEMNEGKDVSDAVSAGKAAAEATKKLESMLTEWMDKQVYPVEVVHIPIFSISPTNIIFLTPPHHNIFPTFHGQLIPDASIIDLSSLKSDEKAQVRRLASSLNSMFDSMNLKEDVFYMGLYSSFVAGILENSPICQNRRKNCSNPASLILIDRTMDMCGVTSHSSESIVDKIMSVLPRLPAHSTDVSVDMSPVCEANLMSLTEDVVLSPGCLYHANDDSCIQTFDYMINKSQKEVMFDLYNKLSNIDVHKSPGPKTLTKVTPQSVEKIVTASKGKYEIIASNLGLLQQSLAAVQTLKSPQYAQIELIMNLEKQVLQNIATSRDSTSILNQISHIIKTRKDRSLSLDRLLALLVNIYSLAGNEIKFSKQHEDNLRETLSVAIFEDHKTLFKSLSEGSMATPEKCEMLAKKIMNKLRDVALLRKPLVKYNVLLKTAESGVGEEYRGVLQQLVEDMVDATRPDLTDLRHKNEGIKDLLRSGLNILTSKKPKPNKHPLDYPVVILFVIGGITAEECKRIHRSVITSGIDSQVLIGSTRMINQLEATKIVLNL